jgi:ribA/ribD-fused uncharacterized protein
MHIYHRSQSVVFCKTTDEFGVLSNMAGGFPLRFNGHDYKSSEHLYQSLRFVGYPDIQVKIRSIYSPMGAKMATRPFRATHTRADWDDVFLEVMRFCLRLKLHHYRTTFGRLLVKSGERPIVEESRRNRDDLWSARARKGDSEVLVGQNTLGIMLMELREEISGAPGGQFPCPSAPIWLTQVRDARAA